MGTAPLVLVEWEDSRRPEPEWRRLAEFRSDSICDCVSVGFLIYDGEETKALAPNMADIKDDKNMQASGVIHIPTRCIKRIVPLEELDGATTYLCASDQESESAQIQPRS